MRSQNCQPFEYFLENIFSQGFVLILYLNFHQIPQETNGLVFPDRWKLFIFDGGLDVIDNDLDNILVVILD